MREKEGSFKLFLPYSFLSVLSYINTAQIFEYFTCRLEKLESDSSDEEVTDDDMDSNAWNEIESESDAEFLEDHGLIEDVTSISEHNTINPIDCYRHFITDEIIDLMVLYQYFSCEKFVGT